MEKLDLSKKDILELMASAVSVLYVIDMFLLYVYQSGRFAILKIDNCYINVGVKNLYEVILHIFAAVLVVLSNYIFYWAIEERRIGRIIGILLGEWVLLIFAVCILANESIISLIVECHEDKLYKAYFLQLFSIFLTAIFINIYGIVYQIIFHIDKIRRDIMSHVKELKVYQKFEKRIQEKKAKKQSTNSIEKPLRENWIQKLYSNISYINTKMEFIKFKTIVECIEIAIIGAILETLIIFVVGTFSVYNTYDYKMAMVNEDNALYPIIYENEDIYIIANVDKSDDGVKIKYDNQKIIDKDGIETKYFSDYRDAYKNKY